MSVVGFDQLPDSTRVWIYAAERKFTEGERDLLERQMIEFIAQWTAHKQELKTGWQLKYDQFIIIAVDESMITASGCSIDSMVHNLAEFQKRIDCQIVGTALSVFFRDDDNAIKSLSRLEFKKLLADNKIDENTVVFDNTVETLGQLRSGQWETRLKQSWHGPAFGLVA